LALIRARRLLADPRHCGHDPNNILNSAPAGKRHRDKRQREEAMWTRRKTLRTAAGLPAAWVAGTVAAPFVSRSSIAQPSEATVALIAPLSGPWARDGAFMRKGAQMAVDDINQAGGVKALGGAHLKLIVADTGDSTERAKDAAQRLVAQEPSLIGGSTGQVSAFALAITEVTERAHLPWMTFAYADQFTKRGFNYIFKTTVPASRIAIDTLPIMLSMAKSATGQTPKTIGIVTDDTPAAQGATKAFASIIAQDKTLAITVIETFTPPISDATPIVQKIRTQKPDLILLLPSAAPDVVQFVNKFAEFRINTATVALGNLIVSPDMRNLIDAKMLNHQMSVVGNWTGNATQDVLSRYVAKYGDPWMTEGAICSYADMWVLKQALEQAGKADREAVGEAMHKLDMTDGPARYYIGGRLQFDQTGQRVGAGIVIAEWLDGTVKTVYPAAAAQAAPVWPKA
jgi:branched-chain amino acid transport system substrate-binding protein